MESIGEIARALEAGGPWTLSALLIVAIWWQQRKIDEKERRIFDLLDKQAQILGALDRLERRAEE